MYKFCVAVFIALNLSVATGSIIGDALENVSYGVLKEMLIGAGDSEFHAGCFVDVLKATGTTSDVKDILSGTDAILDRLDRKARFANFVCSPSGLIIVVLLFGFTLFMCCCCVIRCCCRSTKKPIVIHMPAPHLHSRNNASVPYVKMDVV